METTVSRCGTNSFKRWNLSFLHNEPDETTRRIPKTAVRRFIPGYGCPYSFIFYYPAPTIPDRNPEIPDGERLTTYHKKGNRPICP